MTNPIAKDQAEQLNGSLPSDAVHRKPGKGADYVKGFYVIDTLNEILGPGAWRFHARSLKLEHKERVGDSARVTYVCTGDLYVNGEHLFTDVGVGSNKSKNPGDAIDAAAKTAATDCLKRCARMLGRRMGLALYDKEQNHVRPPEVVDALGSLSAADTYGGFVAWCRRNLGGVRMMNAGEKRSVMEHASEIPNMTRQVAASALRGMDVPPEQEGAAQGAQQGPQGDPGQDAPHGGREGEEGPQEGPGGSEGGYVEPIQPEQHDNTRQEEIRRLSAGELSRAAIGTLSMIRKAQNAGDLVDLLRRRAEAIRGNVPPGERRQLLDEIARYGATLGVPRPQIVDLLRGR